MSINVRGVGKRFGDFVALSDIDLEIPSGQLTALLGPSGGGKSTLLRIIAGLELSDEGTVEIEGNDATRLPAQKRNVGFVFQHYAAFRHMSVAANVGFGLKIRKRPKREIAAKVDELLSLVHLSQFADRLPSQLSGGQRQRMALARALAIEPSVLLLDEPFGALDAKVRKELRRFMRRLHETIHVTTVFVTHDQEEAMEVADRVVVMSHGAIEQIGTPDEVWHEPINGFVYDFLGNYNEFEGWKDDDGTVHLTEYDVLDPKVAGVEALAAQLDSAWEKYPRAARVLRRIAPGLAPSPAKPNSDHNTDPAKPRSATGTPVKLYARPHEIDIAREANGHNEYISARILHINPAGPLAKLELERKNGNLLQAEVPASVLRSEKLVKGMDVLVRPTHTRMFE